MLGRSRNGFARCFVASVVGGLVGCSAPHFAERTDDAGTSPAQRDAGMDGSAVADMDGTAVADMDARVGSDAAPSDASTLDPVGDGGAGQGKGDAGPPTSAASAVALSKTHACAIIRGAARSVYCWGGNERGQLGVPGESGDWRVPVQVKAGGVALTGVQQVAVGRAFSCALRDDRRVVCWGARDVNQTGTRGAGLDYKPTPVVLAEGGTAPNYLPLENIVQIVAGHAYACAIDADGALFCWGDNTYKQLRGDFAAAASNGAIPIPLPEDQQARIVAATEATTCVVTLGQRLYCWGANDEGTAGSYPVRGDAGASHDGIAIATSPQELPLSEDAKPVVQLVGGWKQMVLLAQNGSVWTWGNNLWGQLERTSGACDSAWSPCDPVPGAAMIPSAQLATAVGSAQIPLCAIVGDAHQVWCGHAAGFVTRPEADASVPLEGADAVAGAVGANVSCVRTGRGDIYCHGGFVRMDDTTDLSISEFGRGVKWSFPE